MRIAGFGSALLLGVTIAARTVTGQGATSTPSLAITSAIADADAMVQRAVGRSTAGAVLLVARDGRIIHLRAFGDAERLDSTGAVLAVPRPMRPTTRFDLASVTKVMATTLALMRLVDERRVDLDAPVYRYLAEFRGAHLDSITLRLLLRHASGLTPWQPIYYGAASKAEAREAIRRLPLDRGVGAERRYSDLGFMLLGYVVEQVSRRSLDHYTAEALYTPLGLRRTGFATQLVPGADVAATEVGNGYEHRMVFDTTFAFAYRGDPRGWSGWRTRVLRGEANDGNAYYAHGGVAGHAGLFSTASDLAVLLQLLIGEGTVGPVRLISPATVRAFLTPEPFGHYLGWMRPKALPDGSFMHTGFTGTYVLGVPRYGLAVVLLANRQQMGTDARGFFPDLGPLRDSVSQRLVRGAAESKARSWSGPPR